LDIPQPDRPIMPVDYGVPATDMSGSLPWSWVAERMIHARVYWLATVHPSGRPHLVPNWGAWVEDQFLFSTDSRTVKARNLAANPHLSVSVQGTGDHAVILEGVVTVTSDTGLLARMDDEYERKYGMREGRPEAYLVVPHKVFAFADFPLTPTRWVFEAN